MAKHVAVVQDISGLGRCSLGAALPVLSVLGAHVCPVPTAVFTAQTGYARYAVQDCAALLQQCIASWQFHGVALDGIYTGFCGSVAQAQGAQALITAFRKPGTLLLVDPVLGDDGNRYPCIDDALQAEIAAMATTADVLTPNVTELLLLTGGNFSAFEQQDEPAQLAILRRACTQLGVPTVVVTGWRRGSQVRNLAWQRASSGKNAVCNLVQSPAAPGSFSGTGDLFASALCGGLLRGDSLVASIRRAVRFLAVALADADPANGRAGVPFEPHLKELLH
ncbi:MAG: PfkB family carbohydrate kinase [Oscillospiraceae bacterium]|nr:PfkB family carbohydrate kinase [Oscillospiraceae bacterium]